MDARMSATAEQHWTTRRLLQWIIRHLEQRSIESPRVCAEMLVAAAIGRERLDLYMDPDRPASADERARLRDFVQRASAHEPVQFVVGEAWFFSRPFHVSPATLVPRPSTERLVEEAISYLRERGASAGASARTGDGSDAGIGAASVQNGLDEGTAPAARMLDLCTGSGNIAVSVALARGVRVECVATDLVPQAIDLARRNAARHGAASIEFSVGDLYSALDGRPQPHRSFDLITANPPYVTDAEWPELPLNVRDHEPATALRGGVDGLDLVRRVLDGAPSRLVPGGLLLVEIGHGHRAAALEHAASIPGLGEHEVLVDHEGIDRVLRCVRR